MKPRQTIVAIACACALGAYAHGEDHAGAKTKYDYAKAEETAFGKAADPAKAKRTVRVEMADTMKFSPSEITVKRGESIRFIATNKGQVPHEMVLGTRKELEEHAEAMRRNASMDHHDGAPNMVHVAPGGRGEIGWQFTRAGEFHFGCLVPGHFEAGMVGKVRVK